MFSEFFDLVADPAAPEDATRRILQLPNNDPSTLDDEWIDCGLVVLGMRDGEVRAVELHLWPALDAALTRDGYSDEDREFAYESTIRSVLMLVSLAPELELGPSIAIELVTTGSVATLKYDLSADALSTDRA
jgi:hypothetical protein